MKQKKKFVIITGASRGIGKSITRAFLELGKHVIIIARNQERLWTVASNFQGEFPNQEIIAKAIDLSNTNEVTIGLNALLKEDIQIEVLVNNAGGFTPGTIIEEEEGQLIKMLESNLLSAYNISRVVVKNMLLYSSGFIFNMGSIAGLKAYKNGGSYSIAKYALEGFTANLREELRSKGIKVTTINPGPVWTDSWEGSGMSKDHFIQVEDISRMIISAYQLGPTAMVEKIEILPHE